MVRREYLLRKGRILLFYLRGVKGEGRGVSLPFFISGSVRLTVPRVGHTTSHLPSLRPVPAVRRVGSLEGMQVSNVTCHV